MHLSLSLSLHIYIYIYNQKPRKITTNKNIYFGIVQLNAILHLIDEFAIRFTISKLLGYVFSLNLIF